MVVEEHNIAIIFFFMKTSILFNTYWLFAVPKGQYLQFGVNSNDFFSTSAMGQKPFLDQNN